CVSGRVRKISNNNGITETCPVPFVKVEIFDVDRESCFWPPLRKWWELLLDRPVIRIPDLLKEPPFPGPDPAPDLNFQPLMRSDSAESFSPFTKVGVDPLPEPPQFAASERTSSRVGETSLIDPRIASRLDKLTLTSKIAPWLIFPYCFYSKARVCETTTDCNGYFN